MIPAIKSEFRKLLTVRSTYIVSLLSFALAIFFSFYIEGLKAAENGLTSDHKLQSLFFEAANTMPIFGALIAILLVAHEYRYNTIMYTLTSINSRSKVLLAKIITLSTYMIIFTVMGVLLSVAAMYVGLAIKDYSLLPQQVDWLNTIWRVLFYAWSYGMIGLVLGVLFRNVTMAIASLFVLPSTVEPLLGLLLKENAKYLPLNSLDQVVNQPIEASVGRAAGVFAIYLGVAWLIGWILFLRRDVS